MALRTGVRDVGGPPLLPDPDDGWVITTFLREALRVEPRPHEREVINKIEKNVDELGETLFGSAQLALDSFYGKIRISGTDQEDWSNVHYQDLEQTIWDLRKQISIASKIISQLYMRSSFAYNVYEDERLEAYSAPVSGTREDRNASASQKTRDSKYYYIIAYWHWKSLKDRLDDLRDNLKSLESMRTFIYSRVQ